MKKIYVLIAMLFATSFTFAQMFHAGSVTTRAYTHEMSTAKATTDTTGISANFLPVFAVGLQCTSYSDGSGGYVFGVNGNAFKAVAQGYTAITPHALGIEGIIVWFAGKKYISASNTSKLTFSIFNKPDSIPTTQVGTTSVDLLINACDTNFLAFNCASFPSLVVVNADFSVVCSLLGTLNDTIGILSDQEGEGIGYTAFKYNTTWMTYVKGYQWSNPICPNIALFAVLDRNYANINDDYFFSGAQMSFINPAVNNLAVSYTVENDAKVTFELMGMNGQLIFKQDEGTRTSGNVYNINYNISDLQAGTYFCNLNVNGKRLVKKVVVE